MRRSTRKLVVSLAIGIAAAAPCLADDGLPLPPLASAKGPAAAPATKAPVDLAGRWRVKGRTIGKGEYGGTLELKRAANGLRYERRVRYDLDAPVDVETGTATLKGDELTLQEDRDASTIGMATAATITESKDDKPRRRSLLRKADEGWLGTFTVSVTDERGLERLDKNGVGSDSFELLVDGIEFFPRLRAELATAQRSISVSTFIWKADDTGWSVGNLLSDKAKQGVEVRVICESIGVMDHGDRVLDSMKKSGVKVIVANHWYNNLGNSILGLGKSLFNGIKSLFGGKTPPAEKRGITNHDHRKVVLIDGRSGYVGGMNMAHEYEHDWHDIHSRVAGPVVSKIQEEYLDRWKTYGGEAPSDRSRLFPDFSNAAPEGDLALEVMVTTPGLREEIRQTYSKEIAGARKRVLIENAYVLEDGMINLLQRKAREGVPTTVIIPSEGMNDAGMVVDAFKWVQNEVLKSGVDLRNYPGRMMHGKVAAIDGNWATVGSANLDPLSLTKLCELNVHAHDPRMAKVLEKRIFEPDMALSPKAKEVKLSFWQKLKSGTFHFLRGVL
jgi:cardiolipin synthase